MEGACETARAAVEVGRMGRRSAFSNIAFGRRRSERTVLRIGFIRRRNARLPCDAEMNRRRCVQRLAALTRSNNATERHALHSA